MYIYISAEFYIVQLYNIRNRDYDKLSSISEHSITGLTEGEDYWRIDWIGYLKYDNGLVRFSQPVVDVFLSPLTGHPSSVNFNSKAATDFTKQRKVSLPVGYLVILSIGDIWHKDRFFLSPDYKTVHFNYLLIDDMHCHTIMAKDAVDDGVFYLPFSHHPYHQRATKTYCEVVHLPYSDTHLIIPHYVILSTYFGSSSTLLAYLFTYGILHQDLYDDNKSSRYRADGTSFIHLKTKIPDESASQVARIAWDEQAAKAVTRISNNLTLQSNNNESIRLKTAFPFVGQTNLRLVGKWVSRRDESRAFVVFRILNCSAPYPFEQLEYYRDNPGDKKKDSQGMSGDYPAEGERKWPVKRLGEPQDLTLTPQELPDKDSTLLHLKSPHRTLFDDLLAKPVNKVRQEAHQSQPGSGGINVPIDINSGNVGEGGRDSSVAPTLFTQGAQPQSVASQDSEAKIFKFSKKICRLSLFFGALEQLLLQPKVLAIDYLMLNQNRQNREQNYAYFPATFTAGGRRSTWQYIDYSKGSGEMSEKYRGVVIAKVETVTGVFYLFEIERRLVAEAPHWIEKDAYTLLMVQHKFARGLNQNDIQRILQYTAETKGRWPKATAFPNMILTAMKHPQNEILEGSTQDYIATILRYVNEGTALL